jgi:hypothetical protein
VVNKKSKTCLVSSKLLHGSGLLGQFSPMANKLVCKCMKSREFKQIEDAKTIPIAAAWQKEPDVLDAT